MRDSVRDFVALCSRHLPLREPIYEFGSYQVSGQESAIDLRPMFSGKRYVGADMRPGPGVDVVLNLHAIDLRDASVGTALVLDTIEHVEFVREALKEVYRILDADGIVILSSVMNFPIHSYPNDYWRFTPESFRSLLAPFRSRYVTALGRRDFPHTVIGVGFKGPIPEETLARFEAAADKWSARWRWRIFLGWKEWVRRLVPPVIVESYMQMKIRRDAREDRDS